MLQHVALTTKVHVLLWLLFLLPFELAVHMPPSVASCHEVVVLFVPSVVLRMTIV